MSKSQSPGHLHAGHRERLRAKYIQTEGKILSDHELLELLLFYSIPRANTNGTAHALLDYFGSISRMSDASIDELKLIDGVGESSAILIKLILSFARSYRADELGEVKSLPTLFDAIRYANFLTMGATNEVVYAVYMDANLKIIDTCLIAVGTVNSVTPMIRTIMEYCLLKKASLVMMVHNHPGGGVEPSPEDKHFTAELSRQLKVIGSKLAEHLIVDGVNYHAMLEFENKRKAEYNISPIDCDMFYGF